MPATLRGSFAQSAFSVADVRRSFYGKAYLYQQSSPNAHDTSHAADSDVDAHDESEICQSLDNPLRRESQFEVTANTLPPPTLLLFMKQIVDGDSIFAVLKKAGQNSIVVAADGDKSIISLQGLGNIIAKCGGEYASGHQSGCGAIQ